MKLYLEPFFSGSPLDRMDRLRVLIEDSFATIPLDKKRFILVSGEDIILHANKNDCFFTPHEIAQYQIPESIGIFLGVREEAYYFVKSIDNELVNELRHVDLRSFAAMGVIPDDETGLLAQAFSILKWHVDHQFCPACGGKTVIAYAGWRQDCSACRKQHFPRVDPVVIMLVTCDDYCLLGAGKNSQEQRYSCLAGFMEPGESIENAARRELFEEAGVVGKEVDYVCSQAWPFPSNLMIGVHVNAVEMVLKIDTSELSDARWVHKSEVAAILNGATDRGFNLPPRIAIARTLLEKWVVM